MMPGAGWGLLVAAAIAPASVFAAPLTHGWDCIACDTNSMLAANFGSNRPTSVFNLTDPWWAEAVASRYAALALSDFFGGGTYNGSGTNPVVDVARALKKANPKMKVLVYVAADRGLLTPFGQRAIQAHPEWWLRDDHGNVVWFGDPAAKVPTMDPTHAAFRSWFVDFPLKYFGDEAKALFDGVFVDADGWQPGEWANISAARYDKLFAGKMAMNALARRTYDALNGGSVWGNGGTSLNPIAAQGGPSDKVNVRTCLDHMDGGFIEWLGSFWYMEGFSKASNNGTSAKWNATLMQSGFHNILNASALRKNVIIKAAPGPSEMPFNWHPGAPGGGFFSATWVGHPGVRTNDEVRARSAAALVQTLAPFLIVANEYVFFSHAWFYNMEDGYIPCRPPIECGMPGKWFAEFERPLGPPEGPATNTGFVWRRAFEHASVYVDLEDREACNITWH